MMHQIGLEKDNKNKDEYKNSVYTNDPHINIRVSDEESSYHYYYLMEVLKIKKWYCILSCFYHCNRLNSPYLEFIKTP